MPDAVGVDVGVGDAGDVGDAVAVGVESPLSLLVLPLLSVAAATGETSRPAVSTMPSRPVVM